MVKVDRNPVCELFSVYMSARKMPSWKLAPLVGMTEGSLRNKKCRGDRGFTLSELKLWASVLEIPEDELMEAVRLSMKM